jgi:hypothetical protein
MPIDPRAVSVVNQSIAPGSACPAPKRRFVTRSPDTHVAVSYVDEDARARNGLLVLGTSPVARMLLRQEETSAT